MSKHVQDVLVCDVEQNYFKLIDAFFKCDKNLFLPFAHSTIVTISDLIGFLRQLRSQVRTKLEMASLSEANIAINDMLCRFPRFSERYMQFNVKIANQWGSSKLQRALLKIDEMELLIKTYNVTPNTITDILCAHLL